MKSLISEEIRFNSCTQLSHERYNSGFYLYIAGYLQNKGLDKLAEKFFINGWNQESGHAKQIYDFLVDMNAQVEILQVDKVLLPINSIMDIANAFIDREISTTENLIELKKLCIEQDNGVGEEFYRKMVEQQQEELAEAFTFYDNAELCKDWSDVKHWNDTLEVD